MIRHLARRVCYWVMVTPGIVIFTWALVGYISFEMVSLGPRFGPTVVATGATSVLVALMSMPFIVRASGSSEQRGEQFNLWARRNAKKLIAGGLAIVVIFLAVEMGAPACEHLTRASDAESAFQRFELVGHPNIESDRVEYMLAKFERAHRRLEGTWQVPERSLPISLHFFSDINQYRAAVRLDWSGGLLICRETSITILIPLEKAPDIFSEHEESQTPLHEMVHAMICQSIGNRAFRSIPSWFHEGVAEFHEHEASSHSKRLSTRFDVWINREELMKPDGFCSYIPFDNIAEISLFYATAGEFVRSLATGHGSDALNAVVADVASGMAFENSLRSHFGRTCIDLYSEWSQSL